MAVLFAPSAIGGPPGTFASFTAETVNQTSALATGWIGQATGLSVTPSGYDAELAWTPGTHGPVTGQRLQAVDNGSSSSCPVAGYSPIATTAAATAAFTQPYQVGATTLTANMNGNQTNLTVSSDTGFPASGNYTIEIGQEEMLVTGGQGTTSWTVQRAYNGTTNVPHPSTTSVFQVPDPYGGHYYCFQVVSTSATDWTATADFPATQLGLVATGVSITNGHNQSMVDSGDTVTITFNQQTTMTATNKSAICLFSDASDNATLYLGDTTCKNTGDPYDFLLSGSTFGQANLHVKLAATLAVSASAPWTVTYSVTQNNNQTLGDATWTLTPSMDIFSQNGGSDQAHACTDPTYNCTPTTSQSASAGF